MLSWIRNLLFKERALNQNEVCKCDEKVKLMWEHERDNPVLKNDMNIIRCGIDESFQREYNYSK